VKRSLIAVAGCALALLLGREAQALWVLTDVTPGSPNVGERSFRVTAEPDEGGQRVRIQITPAEKLPLSPYLSGHLWMHDGERFLGEIPVEEDRKGEASVFSMKLAPQVARNSHFEIYETRYPWKKGQTKRPARVDPPRLELMGGTIYRLELGKFLASEQKN
jgi:hypothetical protein